MSFLSQFAHCNEFILFVIAFCNDLAPLRGPAASHRPLQTKNEVQFWDAFYSNMSQSVDFVLAARINLQSRGV